MFRRRSRPLIALACGVLALGLSSPRSNAIEWGAEPSIGIGAEYNDNIFLTTRAHESVHGVNLTPGLDLSARQPNWELRSSTQLTDKRYASRPDLDGDNGTETLSYKFITERSMLQLKGSYASEATWATSRIDADVGLVQTNTRRYTTLANPTWSWLLTEAVQLTADYQWTDVTYDKGLQYGLLDYQQQIPSLSFSAQVAERTKLTAAVAYSEFKVTTTEWNLLIPQYTSKSRSTYTQVGITQEFTETLKGSISAGPRKTTQQLVTLPWVIFPGFTQAQCYSYMTATGQDPAFCFTDSTQAINNHGSVFSGSLESTLERTHTTLSLSRAIDASGSGNQVETTSASLRIDRQLTPDRLSASLTADGYLITALGVTTQATDRHYYALSPGLHWRWTENLWVDGSYRYVRQRYVGASDYARSNAFYVSLSYHWPKFSVSR